MSEISVSFGFQMHFFKTHKSLNFRRPDFRHFLYTVSSVRFPDTLRAQMSEIQTMLAKTIFNINKKLYLK